MWALPAVTSIRARVVYDSRGRRTVEAEVRCGPHSGRASAPSGASVGAREARSFPEGGAERAARALEEGAARLVGRDAADPEDVGAGLREMDPGPGWPALGGAAAFAASVAAAEAAAAAAGEPLFASLGGGDFRLPYPLGNVLGGGAHAGPGTPDIQEVLVCPVGSRDARSAIEANASVHRQLGSVLRSRDPSFTGGRGDEGGWAPRMGNEEALEAAASACEELGYTLGREVALGVDFASSTQWDGSAYDYSRGGFRNSPGEQVDFAAGLIERFKLAYAEDPVHEDDFPGMAELTRRFPRVMVTGDDLTVTSRASMERAAAEGSCSAAILKVNQAGSLHDALDFARCARGHGVALVTSHRSGESPDAHICHIGVATGSAMLKVGVVGGERVAKLNELVRMSEHGLIRGMADLGQA